jgi:hypothetical protein
VFKGFVDVHSTLHSLWLCCNDLLLSPTVCTRFCRRSCVCRRKQTSECICQIINGKVCVKRVGLLNTSYCSPSNVRVVK